MSTMRFLKDSIEKRLTTDKRGTRYRVEGPARDGRRMRVICRHRETGNLIIVTAYTLSEET